MISEHLGYLKLRGLFEGCITYKNRILIKVKIEKVDKTLEYLERLNLPPQSLVTFRNWIEKGLFNLPNIENINFKENSNMVRCSLTFAITKRRSKSLPFAVIKRLTFKGQSSEKIRAVKLTKLEKVQAKLSRLANARESEDYRMRYDAGLTQHENIDRFNRDIEYAKKCRLSKGLT